jgi:predicted ester cyclase
MNAIRSSRVSEQSERNRQAVYRTSDEAITPGNFDLLDELVAPNYIEHSPMGDWDLDAFKATMIPFHEALTGFRMVRELVLVDSDYVTARTKLTGKFERDFNSPNGVIPPNGNDFELNVINIFRFDKDGRIAEVWEQWDNVSFLTQLGAMSPP